MQSQTYKKIRKKANILQLSATTTWQSFNSFVLDQKKFSLLPELPIQHSLSFDFYNCCINLRLPFNQNISPYFIQLTRINLVLDIFSYSCSLVNRRCFYEARYQCLSLTESCPFYIVLIFKRKYLSYTPWLYRHPIRRSPVGQTYQDNVKKT